MQLIRCTQKLLKDMGISKEKVCQGEPATSILGSWYANLLRVSRHKCVLFTNEKTLYSFVTFDASKAQLKSLDEIFRSNLKKFLENEKFKPNVVKLILKEYADTKYAKTISKSVLGSMNDFAFNFKYKILTEGGIEFCDIASIVKLINRIPMGSIDYQYPIEKLQELVKLNIA